MAFCFSASRALPAARWPVADPASVDPAIKREELLTRFRTARDELQEKIAAFACSNEKKNNKERNV